MNRFSLLELSVQARLIWLAETAVAVKFEGGNGIADAVGEGVGDGGTGVGLGDDVDESALVLLLS